VRYFVTRVPFAGLCRASSDNDWFPCASPSLLPIPGKQLKVRTVQSLGLVSNKIGLPAVLSRSRQDDELWRQHFRRARSTARRQKAHLRIPAGPKTTIDDRKATTAAFAAAADPARRALYDVEYRTVGKEDGIIRWVAAKGRGVFDPAGRCLRVAGTAVDVSLRKAGEAALRESEAGLRELNETLERRVLADVIEGNDIFVQVADRTSTGSRSTGRRQRVRAHLRRAPPACRRQHAGAG
jgi:PAS domain-containing protein